jgi:hypothetical protein
MPGVSAGIHPLKRHVDWEHAHAFGVDEGRHSLTKTKDRKRERQEKEEEVSRRATNFEGS